MTNTQYLMRLLGPYGPRLPLEKLVIEMNRLYHAAEARDYERRHPEIRKRLPPLWQEMIRRVIADATAPSWNILDFGCGTGFEAEQILIGFPAGHVQRLVCYDPSPEMLAQCRSRIARLCPGADFVSEWNSTEAAGRRFNLLATNSLLHHLPHPLDTIKRMGALCAPGAFWLAGHEPSRRFFQNPACAKAYACFQRSWRWQRFVVPGKYLQALGQLVGFASDPERKAALQAVRNGLFGRRPSRHAIRRLVDFHVANSRQEADNGRGFLWEQMERSLEGVWTLRWVRSYSFMGPYDESILPRHWRGVAAELRGRFPDDGALFCSIWQRCA